VTLTLTLDRVIRHTVVFHLSTSTYMYIPNFIGIGKTFCGRTDGHLRPTLLGRLRRVDLKTKRYSRLVRCQVSSHVLLLTKRSQSLVKIAAQTRQ